MGIDILGVDIMGVDILGTAILALPHITELNQCNGGFYMYLH